MSEAKDNNATPLFSNASATAAAPAAAAPPRTQAPHSTPGLAKAVIETSTSNAATAPGAAAPSTSNESTAPNDDLPCQWQGCSDRCSSAEALYEHICERHVGRKSTNNLNLTCHWGHCRTTTVKRDHITSHIRVHVPLKPHKCDFCGKAFKRPQDLKKHVKTHADDSVLVRSPEPAPRNHDMSYAQNGRGYGPPSHYYETSNPLLNQSYAPSNSHYYAPHPSHTTTYGNVYYTLNSGPEDDTYGNRKRGLDALNEFLGDVKRRQFDPTSYMAVGQRLHSLQSLNLPILNGPVPIPEYQHLPASVSVGGGYSSGTSHAPGPVYQLPPMSNVRSKSDLINIDQVLEQMQNTIYESEEHVAAAGVGQPGAHYVAHGGMSYNSSNSPASQSASSHATVVTTSAPMMSGISSAHSPGSTPALSPPSSAHSHTSSRSPASTSGGHRVSPQHESSTSMYPRLPSHQSSMTASYAPTSSAAPPSTLGNQYDYEDSRRYTGGTLQRSRPEKDHAVNDMDTSRSDGSDGSRIPTVKEHPATSESPEHISKNVIDPALHSGTSPEAQAESPSSKAATEIGKGTFSDLAETMRIIDRLRELLAGWLSDSNFQESEKDNESSPGEDGHDDDMEGVESQPTPSEDKDSKRADERAKTESSSTSLYPTLRELDDDGDTMILDASA